RLRVARIVDAKPDDLATPAEVVLADRALEHELLEAGESGRKRKLAGRAFLDGGLEHDPAGRAAVDLVDLEVLLEVAERVDARGRTPDLQRVESIALVDAELAADDLVLGQRVAVDVDAFDVDARRLVDEEPDVHRQRLAIALEIGAHVGEGVAEGAGGLGQL